MTLLYRGGKWMMDNYFTSPSKMINRVVQNIGFGQAFLTMDNCILSIED